MSPLRHTSVVALFPEPCREVNHTMFQLSPEVVETYQRSLYLKRDIYIYIHTYI